MTRILTDQSQVLAENTARYKKFLDATFGPEYPPETAQMAIQSAMRLFAAAETRMKGLKIRRHGDTVPSD